MKLSAAIVLLFSLGAEAFTSPRLANVAQARAAALRMSAVAEAVAPAPTMEERDAANADAVAAQEKAVADAIAASAASFKANKEEMSGGGAAAAAPAVATGGKVEVGTVLASSLSAEDRYKATGFKM